MIKVLVVTYTLALVQAKCYIFDDFIIKQYTYVNPEMGNSANVDFQIYDLENQECYKIPSDRAVRLPYPISGPQKGGWSFAGKEITKTKLERVKYAGYKCMRVSESQNISGPLGKSKSKKVSYYANLDKYFEAYDPKVLTFLGFGNNQYDPYCCLIKSELIQEDNKPFPLINVKLEYELADHAMVDRLLAMPVVVDEKQ